MDGKLSTALVISFLLYVENKGVTVKTFLSFNFTKLLLSFDPNLSLIVNKTYTSNIYKTYDETL